MRWEEEQKEIKLKGIQEEEEKSGESDSVPPRIILLACGGLGLTRYEEAREQKIQSRDCPSRIKVSPSLTRLGRPSSKIHRGGQDCARYRVLLDKVQLILFNRKARRCARNAGSVGSWNLTHQLVSAATQYGRTWKPFRRI